jgi:hypothetical protein
MLSSLQPKKLVIRESKIVHKSSSLHPLARFVTEEAVCLMFNINLEDIYVVECWRYVVYVHAKGLSRFVSYADFPPIIGVQPPTPAEFLKWRKRWRKNNDHTQRHQAPKWWAKFFINEFSQAFSESVLCSWGNLLCSINFAFPETTLQELNRELSVSS